MNKAYHIDRLNKLIEKQVIELIPIPENSIFEHFMFTELSHHAYKYNSYDPDSFIEHNYEALRQSQFPDRLSRLTSLFACPDLESVRKWIEELKIEPHTYTVWEIEYYGKADLRDARLLRSDPINMDTHVTPEFMKNALNALNIKIDYFRGIMSDDPLPELIVELPVKVIRKITDF